MVSPLGLSNSPNTVCRLRKSLYGLKQVSRQWSAKLNLELQKQGFSPSHYDPSLFIQRTDSSFTLAAVYVEDIILTSENPILIDALKCHLHTVFTIKDLGLQKFFLGIEINYLHDGITMTQHKFSQELLRESGISSCKHVVIPLLLNLKLQKANSPPFSVPQLYRRVVDKINFLTHTRPDLAFIVLSLNQFM